MEAAFSAPFWCSASPLDATLPGTLVCGANKGLRETVNPLDATLTKNRGRTGGGVPTSNPKNDFYLVHTPVFFPN
jgi:hypothetical protein